MADRIPITVLCGFLGSGKTTVLRHLAQQGSLKKTLVLVNEFGEIGLDHDLLMPIDDDTLVAVDNGCICCTIRADLVQTLSQAPWRYARDGERWFDRVVIETTGIADPAPIIQSIIGEAKVSEQYALAAVLTTVDAVVGLDTLDRHIEAVKQVAVADRILVTKSDLADGVSSTLRNRLKRLASSAPISTVDFGQAEPAWFMKDGVSASEAQLGEIESWFDDAHTHNHADRSEHLHDAASSRHGVVSSKTVTIDAPVDPGLFEACLEMLLRFRGPDLLRIKGIVNVIGVDRPMVIHGVQHVFHPPEILEAWPSDDRRTRLVMITKDLDQAELVGCFTSLGVEAY